MKKGEGMAKALEVAKFILQESEKGLSNLELQKTLYFVELDYQRKYKESLISDDFEAWKYGPVSREVYKEYCAYGADSIAKPQSVELDLSEEKKQTIRERISKISDVPYWKLVEKSHREGGAWAKTYDENTKKVMKKEDIAKEARDFSEDFNG